MPKKTKKEKLLANKRRLQSTSVAIPSQHGDEPTERAFANTFSFSLATPKSSSNSPQTSSVTEYHLMKKDLVKTVFITAIILVSEFLLTRWLPQ